MERRGDVLSRFQDKVAVQSIAAHLSSVTVETNPIGSSDNDKIVRRAVNNNVPALAKTHRPQLTKEQIEINQKAKEEAEVNEADKFYSVEKWVASN